MAKRTSEYYRKVAAKSGLQVSMGSKHIKISGYDQSGVKTTMMLPHELKGNGTEHAIVKWFLRMGIVITLGLMFISQLGG